VDLERGPLSLVSTVEELLERESNGCGLKNREYGRRDPPLWPRDTLYPHKLALTSSTNGGCSVGIVRLRTKATELYINRCIIYMIPVTFVLRSLDLPFPWNWNTSFHSRLK
jgi:hypothetical protein